MIMDLIVTGHAQFASGMVSAANLIIGQNNRLNFIEFTEHCSPEQFKQALLSKIESSLSSELIIFSDLIGGTPYKTAVDISVHNDKTIYVFGGINLPMLIEASLSLDNFEKTDDFINYIKEQGKSSIDNFKFINNYEDDDTQL